MKNEVIKISKMEKIFPLKGSKERLVAVDNVSFEINESETFGLIGESGSGKTTVGRCLLRLLPITSGELYFRNEEYSHISKRKYLSVLKNMQMVFQDPYYSLNPRRTVWETVDSALNAIGRSKKNERTEKIKNTLAKVYINEETYHKYPHQLSMGEQQRLGIARAIVSDPKFIVLDEPTSSLDISVRSEIIDLLVRLQKELGITYLFISHDLSTVQYLCHRVAIMYLGQIVELGSVTQVFRGARHPYSVALLSSVMHPDPKIKRSDYKLKGEIPSPINLPKACYLASRCPEAEDICRIKPPEMHEVSAGHKVKCHFAERIRKQELTHISEN
ncbi:ABC transporter ATP-binding protein [Marispirochaeta sp.]|uniref:ABC transporter ATP-binding protein n=1 Tax=Marispirochaeta sp. TaxID=2038653 RepID=UPI0029C8EABE|nr:ABC transporter ATP-binding protein [Marispirochaeta sp.]